MSAYDRAAPLPWPRVAVVALGALALFAALSFTDIWRRVELKGFDLLSVTTAPYASALPITLIGIDEASIKEIGRQMPWPRSIHAKLLEQLRRAGALVVAFDLVISEPADNPADDVALATAIKESGNVVVASDMAYQESRYARQWTRVDPVPALTAAGASNGLANVTPDGDGVVRNMPDGADVFWREIIRKVNQVRPGMLPEPVLAPGAMVRYAGPDHTFPFFSYYQALEADTMLPADVFRDQLVIVGRELKAATGTGFTAQDMFPTPFTEYTRWLTPGAEVHANILESALRGDSIRPAPYPWTLAMLACVVAICALSMRHWRPLVSLLVAIVLIALVAALDWALFAKTFTWLPAFGSMAAIASVYVAFGGLAFLTEQRRRAEVRRAFSFYVSPEVVESVLKDPKALALGGVRREITVMFTDLKGFTTISEQLGAEELTRLLNEHFTRATAIVKRHQGTVTSFIGDAIMAIFGAPLDDPQHAAHAVAAAIEMQRDIAVMRTELAARGVPPIFMRVGLHTCEAAVGNMGAADRFHYTAMGDGVNLASRLEGVNKLYGTGILVSADTAAKLGEGAALRPVARVVVKGKTKPVDIFTPEDEAAVRAATAAALADYRAHRWDAAEAGMRAVLALRPDDGVALHYLEHIAAVRVLDPSEWKEAEALDKL